jgi:hypothetical protein
MALIRDTIQHCREATEENQYSRSPGLRYPNPITCPESIIQRLPLDQAGSCLIKGSFATAQALCIRLAGCVDYCITPNTRRPPIFSMNKSEKVFFSEKIEICHLVLGAINKKKLTSIPLMNNKFTI